MQQAPSIHLPRISLIDTPPPTPEPGIRPSFVFHRTLNYEPIFTERAEGNYLYTRDGGKILDGCGGAAVISIGHGQERVVQAIASQMRKVSYTHSGIFGNQPAEDLAAYLAKTSGMARVVFHTGGSEAIESSMKLARQFFVEKGEAQRVNFISREQSYHGNTLSALSLSRHTARRKTYLPVLGHTNFHSVSPCYAYRYKLSGEESDEEYVKRLADELEAKFQELGPDTVVAFYAETVGGATTGTLPAVPGYFKAMREVCDRHGALLVLDEIMCGIGRTGKMHAWEWEGVRPDLQTVGKGLGGGYAPLSAVLISQKVVDVMEAGSGAFNNGFTYQSHVAGCAGALEVMRIIEEEGLIGQCLARGRLLERKLHEAFDGSLYVGNIRGRGLFWSIELIKDRTTKTTFPATLKLAEMIVSDCIQNGLVLYVGKGTVDGIVGDHVLIAPPYTVTEDEVGFLVATLSLAVERVCGEQL